MFNVFESGCVVGLQVSLLNRICMACPKRPLRWHGFGCHPMINQGRWASSVPAAPSSCNSGVVLLAALCSLCFLHWAHRQPQLVLSYVIFNISSAYMVVPSLFKCRAGIFIRYGDCFLFTLKNHRSYSITVFLSSHLLFTNSCLYWLMPLSWVNVSWKNKFVSFRFFVFV